MTGETNLSTLLRSLQPALDSNAYVFCCLPDRNILAGVEPIASIRESEGLSAVLLQDDADRLGLPYDYVAAWITLTVHSSLAAVGLTASFAQALAQAGISCNVIAGFHHDHLFVAISDAERAMSTLRALAVAGSA